jgi:hypothetical protein
MERKHPMNKHSIARSFSGLGPGDLSEIREAFIEALEAARRRREGAARPPGRSGPGQPGPGRAAAGGGPAPAGALGTGGLRVAEFAGGAGYFARSRRARRAPLPAGIALCGPA